MTTTLETTNGTAAPAIRYDVTESEIAELKANYAAIEFDTKAGYANGMKALANCRGTRTALDRRKKDLNADADAWRKKVNAAHKYLYGLVEKIEQPLKDKREAVDKAEELARKAREEAEWVAKQDAIRAENAAKEAELAAKREADEARIAQERRDLEEQKAQLAEQRRRDEETSRQQQLELAELRREQNRVADENRKVEEARAAAERQEQERLARIKAREEAEARRIQQHAEYVAEVARIEADRAEEAKRLEALKPDIERVHDFARTIRAALLAFDKSIRPVSKEARTVCALAREDFDAGCGILEGFGK